MNKHVLSAVFLAGVLGGMHDSAHAHGGQYRGPGDTVPPGGGGAGGGGSGGPSSGPGGPTTPGPGGPTTPGPGAPGAPGGSQGGAPTTGSGGGAGSDLTQWTFWWEFNKEPYLNLKSHVHRALEETGSDWFLGQGTNAKAKDSLKPTEQQVRETIVPALLEALEGETNNDIVTGAMIALAKIGDAGSETGDSRFESAFTRFLSDKNQEIAETAAVAMGILGNPRSIPTLASLLTDSAQGRKLVAQPEVGYRTRAFAAYGLGLIGARTAHEEDRKQIVMVLRQALETDSTKNRDLKVSCIVAMGLVPLATIHSGAHAGKGDLLPPESSRTAQLDYLLAFLQNEEQHYLVRAHCPCALARLLSGIPDEQYDSYRERIASDLIERLDPRKKEKEQLVQSAVLALGMIGTNDDGNALDRRIRESVASAIQDVSDQQARNFSLIALAKMGGTFASRGSDAESGIEDVTKTLVTQLTEGKSGVRPWAGLACGVLGRKLGDANFDTPRTSTLQGVVRSCLREEKDPDRIAALAISAGIMGDTEAAKLLMGYLARQQDDAQGYVAIGLGLMNARDAIGQIEKLVEGSKYRPETLKQSAIALGLLGDKEVVPKLVGLLREARGLSSQAAIASALGFIGDRRSIDPLVQMLQNDELTGAARGFAAVALGIIGDKELLPWNSKIGLDLNYRASTETLTNQATGILDIL